MCIQVHYLPPFSDESKLTIIDRMSRVKSCFGANGTDVMANMTLPLESPHPDNGPALKRLNRESERTAEIAAVATASRRLDLLHALNRLE